MFVTETLLQLMVYSKVEIWRGYALKFKDFIRVYNHYVDEEDKIDANDKKICIYSMLDRLKECIDDNVGGNDVDCVKLFPCCGGRDLTIMIGIKLTTYRRATFSWEHVKSENRKYVHDSLDNDYYYNPAQRCGKLFDGPHYIDNDRCGRLYVCAECIGLTENGWYPVKTILNERTECTTYCFKCNKDKCDLTHIPNDKTLTCDKLIDRVLHDGFDYVFKQITESSDSDSDSDSDSASSDSFDSAISSADDEEQEMNSIKNYYRLDDCLSCT